MNNLNPAVQNPTPDEELVTFQRIDTDMDIIGTIGIIGFSSAGNLRRGHATPTGITLLDNYSPVYETDKLAISVNDRETLIIRHKKTGQVLAVEACLDHFLVNLPGGQTVKVKQNQFLLSDAQKAQVIRGDLCTWGKSMSRVIAKTTLMEFYFDLMTGLKTSHKNTYDRFGVTTEGPYIIITLGGSAERLKVGRYGFTVMKQKQ